MAVYLRRGLGRVVLFLREQNGGAADFRDVILYGVLHDVRFEGLEDGRAVYLHDVIKATGEPDWYAARLCEALLASAATDEDDEIQRCELAGLLAQNENENARRALYAAFARGVETGNLNRLGADIIIALDGASGFQAVVQGFQAASPSRDGDTDYFILCDLIEKLGGEAEARQATEHIALEAPGLADWLRRLWDEWGGVQNNRAKWTPEELAPPAYEVIHAALDEVERTEGGSFFRHLPFRLWSRTASDETLLRLAHDVEVGGNEKRLRVLLRFFEKRPFPLVPTALLSLAEDENPRLAKTAVRALVHTMHPYVRAQGLKFIANGRAGDGVKLLINNPGEEDAVLFADLLKRTDDEDELHYAGIALRGYCEANPVLDLVPALIFLYENGPCSMCRGHVVELLIKANALPDALRTECRYDAYKSTQEAVAAPSDEQ